jgi:hypothetical protein
MDLSKIQEAIANASNNEQLIGEMRKAYSKLQAAFDEFSVVFQSDYQPAKKERKPRAEGAKRPGRPKKVENQG